MKRRSSLDSAWANRMNYFDSHCHLGDQAFADDLEKVYKASLDIGVTRMLTLGWDLESSKQAVALAERFGGAYAVSHVSDSMLKR